MNPRPKSKRQKAEHRPEVKAESKPTKAQLHTLLGDMLPTLQPMVTRAHQPKGHPGQLSPSFARLTLLLWSEGAFKQGLNRAGAFLTRAAEHSRG